MVTPFFTKATSLTVSVSKHPLGSTETVVVGARVALMATIFTSYAIEGWIPRTRTTSQQVRQPL
ncbi:hypothetical protein EYM_01935 [Ignicoccus islandicus DSM 13165]|uniref:Uncharacterized protein n=1 Tax=Ignicoccus islandicus DSM 13165 TaxID=940295 RepID=A0A0U3E2X6_9CREN|nr:hypothetical protein EYM_01935 [Ignicoccus islandicus DSM 13165]